MYVKDQNNKMLYDKFFVIAFNQGGNGALLCLKIASKVYTFD